MGLERGLASETEKGPTARERSPAALKTGAAEMPLAGASVRHWPARGSVEWPLGGASARGGGSPGQDPGLRLPAASHGPAETSAATGNARGGQPQRCPRPRKEADGQACAATSTRGGHGAAEEVDNDGCPSVGCSLEGKSNVSFKSLCLIRKIPRQMPKKIPIGDHGIIISAKDKTCEEVLRRKKLENELCKLSDTTEKEEDKDDVSPADVVKRGCQDETYEEVLRRKKLENELGKLRDTTEKEEEKDDVSPADVDKCGFQVATDCGKNAWLYNNRGMRSAGAVAIRESIGNRDKSAEEPCKSDWGNNFQLRLACTTAGTEHSNSHSNKQIIAVVDNISELLSFDPDLTLVEFASDINGKELGRLFRIAKALGFKKFVRNDVFDRAMLHYVCSHYDGARRGHNLDAVAKELFGPSKGKKK
ncbi:hypothetical protein ACP70R_011868 [Stipagrostis hirtigluma subsp. patula]